MSLETVFTNFPVLRTDRLVLREPRMNDAGDVFSFKSDPEGTMGYCTEPYQDIAQAKKWITSLSEGYARREHILWFITLIGEDRVIGDCTLWHLDLPSLCGELGYELHKDYWKRGIASEAAREVLRFAFTDMGLNRVEANPFSHNEPSHKLLRGLNFTFEGTLREKYRFRGKYYDQALYGILSEEWNHTLQGK